MWCDSVGKQGMSVSGMKCDMKNNDMPRERIRREYTNASGYFCPTENQAIYNADRGIRETYTEPQRKVQTETLRVKNKPAPAPPPKPKDENLKRARQLYAALCGIASMMDVSIEEITLKCKGDPYRYKNTGDKKALERVTEADQ